MLSYSTIKEFPPLRLLRRIRYTKFFAREKNVNIFDGIYSSFAEAAAAAPKTKVLGFNNDEPASMYDNRLEIIHSMDYPVLFWLSRLIDTSKIIFDLGGHVGLYYYAFKTAISFPETLTWVVSDVAKVADHGRAIAKQRGITNLVFTSEPTFEKEIDVYIASGALQYIESSFPELLKLLPSLPRHIIINKLPLHSQHSFITLQSIGTAFCPYKVQQKDDFLNSVLALGYKVKATWQNAELACILPFQKEYSVQGYTGFCLEREK